MIRQTTIEIDVAEVRCIVTVQYWYAPATWGRDGGCPEEIEIISARDADDMDLWDDLPGDIQQFIVNICHNHALTRRSVHSC